ncbi:MAG: tRNA (adenosine(37)-N6)-threonylcarbamoyltransferase complex transferase subunit TsaD [Aliishimia sp.]
MTGPLICLGIESSCDDTAAALVQAIPGQKPTVLSSIVHGQADLHAAFGGIVPEIAARAHAEKLDTCVKQALVDAEIPLTAIDMIAATSGPGLIGGVMSGVMCAKGLSAATGASLYGINHLAGHALTPRLTDDVPYPYLMLLVSGGHCQFLIVKSPMSFVRLGGTIDDAPGEAFDKVARLLGLQQPGGPSIEKVALIGDNTRFKFPRPLANQPNCNLSFSGLKTAILRARDALIETQGGLTRQDQADLAASFQTAVADVLARKSRRALDQYFTLEPQNRNFCVAGGVAANNHINSFLKAACAETGTNFVAPPLALCTDNAAMIAAAGLEQMPYRDPDGMTLSARPRWPLDTSQPALVGSGKKGAKA